MNSDAREILALFVMARREQKFQLTHRALAEKLNLPIKQIHAVEARKPVRASTVEVLGKWCGIELVQDEWRVRHASH